MSVVIHRTNNIKEPSRIPPGINMRRDARTRIMMRKRTVKPPVMTAKVKILEES
jgi:hypothetical protein